MLFFGYRMYRLYETKKTTNVKFLITFELQDYFSNVRYFIERSIFTNKNPTNAILPMKSNVYLGLTKQNSGKECLMLF